LVVVAARLPLMVDWLVQVARIFVQMLMVRTMRQVAGHSGWLAGYLENSLLAQPMDLYCYRLVSFLPRYIFSIYGVL
jgi:hypothetical protein